VAAGPEAGFLFLAMRAMAIPMGLIGGAISQVYLSRSSDEMRAGQLAPFTLKIIAGLMRTGVGPLMFLGIVAPMLFPLLFGASWQRAGEMVAWMTPWFVMQFLSSPVSMSLHVTGHQRMAMVLQIFGLVMRVGAVAVAVLFNPGLIFTFYALSGLFFYAVYFFMVILTIDIKVFDILRAGKIGYTYILIWISFGLLTLFSMDFLGK
jgi:O-antigen/teichoic acid export membrane protein